MDTDAAQPAAPKRRRCWFQFSLRTLMIVVAVVCALLGSVGAYVRWEYASGVGQEEQALAELRQLGGGLVQYEPVPPTWFQHLICPNRYFDWVAAVRLLNFSVTDDHRYTETVLRILHKFPTLGAVVVYGMSVHKFGGAEYLDVKVVRAEFPNVFVSEIFF